MRILIPEETDSALVGLSGWSYLSALEAVNIRVFHYTKGFMHHKVTLVDQQYCTIGTANFDNRSFRLNFEITMAFDDEEMAGRVEEMLIEDFSHSTEASTRDLEMKGFWFKLASKTARLMAPLQ